MAGGGGWRESARATKRQRRECETRAVLTERAVVVAVQAMTGVKPDDTCSTSFEGLKAKKESRFIIYTITADGKHITKAASEPPAGDCQADWEKFAGVLTGEYASKCCYAVFDFDWEADDGHSAQKIMFVLWSPEGAKVKDKMMTTGSKDALKKALVGIGQDFQATDASEITFEECLTKAKSAVRLGTTCARRRHLVRSAAICSLRHNLRLTCVRALVCAVHERLSFCTQGPACGHTTVMWWLSNDKLERSSQQRSTDRIRFPVPGGPVAHRCKADSAVTDGSAVPPVPHWIAEGAATSMSPVSPILPSRAQKRARKQPAALRARALLYHAITYHTVRLHRCYIAARYAPSERASLVP